MKILLALTVLLISSTALADSTDHLAGSIGEIRAPNLVTTKWLRVSIRDCHTTNCIGHAASTLYDTLVATEKSFNDPGRMAVGFAKFGSQYSCFRVEYPPIEGFRTSCVFNIRPTNGALKTEKKPAYDDIGVNAEGRLFGYPLSTDALSKDYMLPGFTLAPQGDAARFVFQSLRIGDRKAPLERVGGFENTRYKLGAGIVCYEYNPIGFPQQKIYDCELKFKGASGKAFKAKL